MSNEHKEQLKALLELTRSALERDKALREELQIGVKFKFVSEKLEALFKTVNQHCEELQEVETEKASRDEVQPDEMMVWVYIYNVQGLVLQTWQKMLLPQVFYEYSVNRPIYTDKMHVESLIRSKPNRVQHGYITMIVKKADVLPDTSQDACGNTVIKVREGALHFDRLVLFTHNQNEYLVGESGQMEKKTT